MESGPAPEDVEYEQGLKRWLSDYRAALAAQESPREVTNRIVSCNHCVE